MTPLESVRWIHGSEDCRQSNDPIIQVHKIDEHSFIMRLSKCFSYEANFIYLFFGRERAILLDTGAPAGPQSPTKTLPIRDTVDSLVREWLDAQGGRDVELIVAHTHSHGDHRFWDSQFEKRGRTTIIRPTLDAVTTFFGLADWPKGQAGLDLGGRQITVFPIPGHESTHIALYDERLKALLTGDTLYPGLLTVENWGEYRDSAARLARFARQNEVSYVLGNHIEMKNVPGELYPIRTIHQPNEHPLPLTSAHVEELHAVCEAMGNSPQRTVRDNFIVDPR